jgi:hypothetical protein
MEVAVSLEPGLDKKAIECVRDWRFRSEHPEDGASETEIRLQINFRLPDRDVRP